MVQCGENSCGNYISKSKSAETIKFYGGKDKSCIKNDRAAWWVSNANNFLIDKKDKKFRQLKKCKASTFWNDFIENNEGTSFLWVQSFFFFIRIIRKFNKILGYLISGFA